VDERLPGGGFATPAARNEGSVVFIDESGHAVAARAESPRTPPFNGLRRDGNVDGKDARLIGRKRSLPRHSYRHCKQISIACLDASLED
jgi:hypothetical protein